MPMLPATLLLLAAAPSASTPRLQEGLPASFQADGQLDEWKQPPSLTLGASSQVAGASKVSSPDDLSARVWLAAGPEGLAIAGEVRDDKVQLTAKKEIHADHVEVWLALPPPQMPPIAFINHLEESYVPKEAECDKVSQEDPAACRAWWKQQTARRKQLQSGLVAQYGVMPGGVVRFGLDGSAGKATYTPFPGGYRFEALIPASAFPRTAQAPLRGLRVLVDLVDSDEGGDKQETFLSSSPRRRFGDPSTFHAVTLKKPLRFGQWPELLERALKEQPGASYQPGPDADSLQVWVNPAQAYQYTPTAPSPGVVQVDLGSVKSLGKVGDVELVSVPALANDAGGVDHWLVSRKGQTILQTHNAFGDQVRLTRGAPGLRILRIYDGTASRLGAGTCGACPLVSFEYLTLDASGRFSETQSLEGAGGRTGYPVEWTVSPDLSRIEAFDVDEDDTGKRGAKHLATRHTFDAKTGRYTTETFEPTPEPGLAEEKP